jgi:hypothetical protein
LQGDFDQFPVVCAGTVRGKALGVYAVEKCGTLGADEFSYDAVVLFGMLGLVEDVMPLAEADNETQVGKRRAVTSRLQVLCLQNQFAAFSRSRAAQSRLGRVPEQTSAVSFDYGVRNNAWILRLVSETSDFPATRSLVLRFNPAL